MAIPLLARLAGSGTGPINISVKFDLDQLKRDLTRQQKDQLPFATSMALNLVAADVADEITKQMDRNLDRPTPFTKKAYQFKTNSFRGKRANKRTLTAIIEPAKIQEAYLKFQIAGGTRLPKNRAIIVPGRTQSLNAYGNMRRGEVKKILANKTKYFSGVPKGQPEKPAGIWERMGTKNVPGGAKIRLAAIYTDTAKYRPIFPIHKIAQGVSRSRFPRRFAEAMRRAMATAR